MTFFKLDTGQLRNFDAALDGTVRTYSTKTHRVLANLARHIGWPAAVSTLLRAFFASDPVARHLVSGNLDRKRIRLPGVFGNAVVSGVYGWVKKVQGSLLREALTHELSFFSPDITIVYNGSLYPESVLGDVSAERRRVFVEAGFFPGTLQIDPKGLNAANSVPRDPTFYLSLETDFAKDGLPQAVNNRKSKTSSGAEVQLNPGYVFVPFQVPSDMQVTVHSPWIRNMEMFLDAVLAAAERNPEETFVIKEHPSFKRSVRDLRPAHPRVIFANHNVTSDLIQNARVVVTLNSTVGIEALLYERPTITLGNACYNIEGLVLHAPNDDALDKALRESKNWSPGADLRQQFIGYLWNDYLVKGRYDALPENLSEEIAKRA